MLSAPLIIVLIVLLGSADPVIQWGTDRISSWLPDWSFPPRLIFFLFLLSITLGANSIASRQIEPALPNFPGLDQKSTVGITEQRMMLWSAAVVLWLFVLVPMLISRRDAVRRTSDVALATRVLNTGRGARLLRRGRPAAPFA